MIKAKPILALKPLHSISPSQLNRLDGCALQVSIQKSHPEGFLPPGAMTYFGNATHKVIELATKGELTDEPAIRQRFDELIAEYEAELLARGWTYLVPLKLHVVDFGPRRKRAIQRALSLVPTHTLTMGVLGGSYQIEERFQSDCKKVVGYIDAIRKTPDGIEIIDYKSGQILDETGLGIKAAYRQQLWLYAYLYWQRHGIWPVRLLLIGLTGAPVEVPYLPADAIATYQHAVSRLAVINEQIDALNWSELAIGVDPSTCSYCPVRPACPSYTILPSAKGFSDIVGSLTLIRELANGTLFIQLSDGESSNSITDVPMMYQLTLRELQGQSVQVITARAIGANRFEWLGQTVLFW